MLRQVETTALRLAPLPLLNGSCSLPSRNQPAGNANSHRRLAQNRYRDKRNGQCQQGPQPQAMPRPKASEHRQWPSLGPASDARHANPQLMALKSRTAQQSITALSQHTLRFSHESPRQPLDLEEPPDRVSIQPAWHRGNVVCWLTGPSSAESSRPPTIRTARPASQLWPSG